MTGPNKNSEKSFREGEEKGREAAEHDKKHDAITDTFGLHVKGTPHRDGDDDFNDGAKKGYQEGKKK